jgi:hypothetical protein
VEQEMEEEQSLPNICIARKKKRVDVLRKSKSRMQNHFFFRQNVLLSCDVCISCTSRYV